MAVPVRVIVPGAVRTGVPPAACPSAVPESVMVSVAVRANEAVAVAVPESESVNDPEAMARLCEIDPALRMNPGNVRGFRVPKEG